MNEPHIIINSDRTITVPDEFKIIAYKNDHNIHTLTFDCPRYHDGRDLSAMNIWINYRRKDKVEGSWPAENIIIDDIDSNLMHFDWTIQSHSTQVKGKFEFSVCALTTDDEGNEEKHWNTHICKTTEIGDSIGCNEPVVSQYPDVINHILNKLDSMSNYISFEALVEAGVITPVASNENEMYTDENGKIYIL